jgi:hypothetical protein
MAKLVPTAALSLVSLLAGVLACAQPERWVRAGLIPANETQAQQMNRELEADMARCSAAAEREGARAAMEQRASIHNCLLKKGWRVVAEE